MNTREAIQSSLNLSMLVTEMFLADLSDADLLERPVSNANHIAWQLGHIIETEARGLAGFGGPVIELPPNFKAQHSKDTAASTSGFLTKQEYLDLWKKVRAALLTHINTFTDEQFDTPTPGPMARLAPTAGAMFLLFANHQTMHAGQFSVVRRKLGKPVLF